MARMFPPDGPFVWTQSGVERRMYHLLQAHLDDEFTVFQSVILHFFHHNKTRVEREADYIILHPDYGLIVLEIKAHRKIICKGPGDWYTLDTLGRPQRIDDPIHQVNQEEYALRAYLKRHAATQKFHYPTIRSLWFPLADWGHRHVPGLPPSCILDREDVAHPLQAIMRIFQQQPSHLLSVAAVDALIDAFAEAFILQSSLASEIRFDDLAITSLTHEQFRRLEQMRHTPRLLIPGAAGTGKTILTYEAAWRVAATGQRVLLLNYTSLQADWLREMHQQNPHSAVLDLDIHDIRSLAVDLGEKSQQSLQAVESFRIDSTAGQHQLSQYFEKCLTYLTEHHSVAPSSWQYEAIFVDEGQDFEKPIWDQLLHLLADPAEGLLYVFYDEAQRIDFPYAWVFPGREHTLEFRLQANIRNSHQIFDLMQHFNPDRAYTQQEQFALEGRIVEYIDTRAFATDDDQGTEAALYTILHRLIQNESVQFRQILIITCRSQKDSRYRVWTREGYPIKAITKRKKDAFIGVSTIRSAKGLESDIVILVELDGIKSEREAKRSKLLYTAISRAKHHLIVLGTEHELFTHAPMQMTLPHDRS